jgi:CheY-like chemotaxis protein
VTIQRSRVDLQDVVDRALELVSDKAARVAVTRPSAALLVDGDAVRLTQVLSNLLGNALKFTPPSGHVQLVIGQDGDDALLEVVDDGIGIDPKLLPFVFDPFVQGEQMLGRTAGGLGLGLAIVKALVELHGGTVGAHSAGVGQGCRFVVRLPLARSAHADAVPEVPASAPPRAPTKLLVVDDNVDAAESITLLLQEHGFDVRTATSGEDALAQLDGFAPSGILADIGLPTIDGYELCKRVRARPGGEEIRLVALTGYGRHEDRAKAVSAGFDAHLAKPVTPQTLLSTLAHLLGGGSSNAQGFEPD